MNLVRFALRRPKLTLFCALLGTFLLFIVDNTIAPPLVNWLKETFGLDEIHVNLSSISIQVSSIALGIYLGFLADRVKAGNELYSELSKILPLIEFEIRTNYEILIQNPPNNLKQDDFMLDYWEIYKDDVARWAPINITVVTEIYGLLSKWNKNYDRKARIIQNSVLAIETWVDWYAGNLKGKPSKSVIKKRNDVIIQLEKLNFSQYKRIALDSMKKSEKYPFNPTP